jgi:hypothetical protein
VGEILTVIKTLIITAVIVFAMQVNVSGRSLEFRFLHWIRSSSITQQLNQVAHGAVLGAQRGTEKISQFFSKTVGNNEQTQNASRLNIQLKRSDAYLHEQSAKRAEQSSSFTDE